jgi:hypothetical protein
MKNIVLINSSLQGHNLAFVRTFSKVLLEQGHSVYCIVPEPERISTWIAENCPGVLKNFKGYIYTVKLKKFKFRQVGRTLEKLSKWRKEGELVKLTEQENKVKIDLVFYAWLDYQLATFMPQLILDLVFPYKWSGLYFHPYHLRKTNIYIDKKANWRDYDSVFLSKNCVAIAVHDQSIIEKFSKRIRKPVIHFPETADDSRPDLSNPHYIKIRQNAKGRIVIGMIGCEKHKGTLTMIRLAKIADPSKYYFVFMGVLPNETYTDEEWTEIQEFIHSANENCYFFFKSIPEGAAYNAVFCAFDIPFLIYSNFISSSNRLTKAAIFKKLVLASDNYCIGDDVGYYKLGEAVQPENYRSALNALEKLAEKINNNDYPVKEWEKYTWINSEEILKDRFREIIDLI